MNKYDILKLAAAAAFPLLVLSCTPEIKDVEFGIDSTGMTVGPDGGEQALKLEVNGSWVAVTDEPWIKISPSNGVGSVNCKVEVDSTVLAVKRSGLLQIIADGETAPLDFAVTQDGYPKEIRIEQQPEVIPNYGPMNERTLEVKVVANVPFGLNINDSKPWVKCEEPDAVKVLDRGYRPRTFTLKFDWENNPRPSDRSVEVLFDVDESEGTLAVHDKLTLKQVAAEEIIEGIKGDSLAILACARAFGNTSFDPSERMMHWDNVVLWQATDSDLGDNTVGRVRHVKFSGNTTKEEIPFEIQYLTQAESISIYGNINTMRLNLSTGEYISKLTNLKSLQIFAFGISEVHESLRNLVNLEALDLSGNNLDKIPEMFLDPANFPNLTYLSMTSNSRYTMADLNTTTYPRSDWEGFSYPDLADYDKRIARTKKDLARLFSREKLEYLRLSNNLMQGSLPDEEDMKKYVTSTWQAGDKYKLYYDGKTGDYVWHEIPAWLVGKPKVLPNATYCALNLNYFTGELPEWILFHPHLMWWDPFRLVFNQYSKYMNEAGENVGFDNVPATPEYYYEKYPEQRNIGEEGGPDSSESGKAALRDAIAKFNFVDKADDSLFQ